VPGPTRVSSSFSSLDNMNSPLESVQGSMFKVQRVLRTFWVPNIEL
jgi:hypothetical protein